MTRRAGGVPSRRPRRLLEPARRVDAPGRPCILRLPFQRATTEQVSSIYPFQIDEGLGVRGICMGINVLSGCGFFFDPFTLYTDKVITNPNVIVLGEVGAAKSSVVKTLMARHVGLLGSNGVGREIFAVDPKQEYRSLAEALGIPLLQLRPGGAHRVNPLAAGDRSGESRSELLSRRSQLLVALLSSIKGRPLEAHEHAVLGWALEALAEREDRHSPTLSDLASELAHPSAGMAARAQRRAGLLAEEARSLWLDVDRLLTRDLAGMFDGERSLAEHWRHSERGLVLDVSAVFHDRRTLSLVMLAAISALQSIYSAGNRDERLVPRRLSVVDEGWAVLGDEDAARFFQSSLKLSRRWGVANVLVFHRLSDAGAQADSGSAASKITEGLVADAEVKVVFRTHPRVLEQTMRALALTEEEGAALGRLPRGRALWKLAGTSAFVDHVRSDFEAQFTDTDARMQV